MYFIVRCEIFKFTKKLKMRSVILSELIHHERITIIKLTNDKSVFSRNQGELVENVKVK